MKPTDYKEDKLTWQAHSVLMVEQECLLTGKFPNGKRMSAAEIKQSEEQINNCKSILINYGCIDSQTKLDFDEDFEPCDNCDIPDACADFAIEFNKNNPNQP